MDSDSRLIFEKGYNHPHNNFIPKMDIECVNIDDLIWCRYGNIPFRILHYEI